MPHRPDRRRASLATALLALVLTACAAEDDGSPSASGSGQAPDPAETATTSTSSVPTSTDSPTSTPSSPASSASVPSSEARPATGPVLRGASFSLRAPEGWTVAAPISDFVRLASGPDGGSDILVGFLEAGDDATVDSLEQVATVVWRGNGRPKTLPRIEVDGVELYHLRGLSTTDTPLDEYGTRAGDLAFSVSFDLPLASPAERQEVIDSVLASLRWR